MEAKLIIIFVLNLLDFAFSNILFKKGCDELNPILRWMTEYHIRLIKLFGVPACLIFLWLYRHMPIAQGGATFLAIVYGFLIIYELALLWKLRNK